jgi:DNA gyrase subunit A
MSLTRPNLDQVDPDVIAYIEYLEGELAKLHQEKSAAVLRPHIEIREDLDTSIPIAEPEEPPTSVNVIVATSNGLIKRTPRHLYARQRRGGMGIFDIESPDFDPPSLLTLADQAQTLLVLTDQARAFRLPVNSIHEAPIRARGESIVNKFDLDSAEKIAIIIPEQAQGYLALLSQSGIVRLLRHHVFGEYMKPGTNVYDFKKFGPLVSASWTTGDGDLFIATRKGLAIRFSEKLISPQGTQAIRLTSGDMAVSVTHVSPDSGVFLLSDDGKGAIRLMTGFNPNKSPGGGGKVAIKTDRLICALNSDNQQDIFIITQLSKIIRFRVDEVPPKEGVVQGVICISLRNDLPVAVALNPLPSPL